jgi:hypothetical protein
VDAAFALVLVEGGAALVRVYEDEAGVLRSLEDGGAVELLDVLVVEGLPELVPAEVAA